MGNFVLRVSRPAPREPRAKGRTAEENREGQAYDRSSTAVEHNNNSFPHARLGATVLMYTPGKFDARGVYMFRGLDQRVPQRSRTTTVLSLFAHVFVIAAVIWVMTMHGPAVTTETTVVPVQFTLYDPPPPPVMHVAKVQGGGGGGGAHHLVAPQRAKLPRVVVKTPVILPRIIARVDPPKLPVPPAAPIRLPQESPMPRLGMPQSPQVTVASQGPGARSGFGFGFGGGMGTGHSTGQGPGSGGGYGGGVMNVGGGVSAPEVIHSVEPQFTPQARQADYQGTVAIQLIVDSQGNPQDVRVVRHLGMGLDDEAIAAVRQYRFKPALYQGQPVAVQMVIEVDFHLH
jgi:periplasmic protein TonB